MQLFRDFRHREAGEEPERHDFCAARINRFETRADDLLFLKRLVEAGALKPVIERRFPLSQVGDALRHVGRRRSRGQTVIQVA